MKYTEKVITIKVMDTASLKMDMKMYGISYDEMAEKLSLNKAVISRWANGKAEVPEKYFAPIEELVEKKKEEILEYMS